MKNPSIEYTKGVSGKVVERILFSQDNGEPCIEIRFQDKTSMYFELRPKVTLEPELMSWKSDEGRTTRRYPEITTAA